jgi:hypothetical protein
MQKVRKKDYIVSLPNLIEPPWFWCGRRVHRCSLITGRSPTLIPVPFLLTNIKQQKLLQNQTHMKSIQKKNFMKKNVFFWIEIKRKVGFFLSLSSLFKKKKMTKTSQITHTNPITNLCLSLLQPLLSTFPTKQRFPTVFSRAKVVKIRSNFRIKPLVFCFFKILCSNYETLDTRKFTKVSRPDDLLSLCVKHYLSDTEVPFLDRGREHIHLPAK